MNPRGETNQAHEPAPSGTGCPGTGRRNLAKLAGDLKRALDGAEPNVVFARAHLFYRELARQIREVDSAGGLYSEIERAAPAAKPALDRLRGRQRELLTDLEIICADVDDDLGTVSNLIRECLELAARHEAEEDALQRSVFGARTA